MEIPSESNKSKKSKDGWDKFHVIAQAFLAFAALLFAGLFGWYQQENAGATLQLARSNFELAKSQVKVLLLPSLLSENARQQTIALYLAKVLDEQFAIYVTSVLALHDPNERVRAEAEVILWSLAQSKRDEVKQEAEKSANQYYLVKELRALGLLKKLQEARGYIEGGSPNGNEEALKLYHEVLKQLSIGALEKLDRGLLIDAQEDEKGGYKEHAARKYRALFQDYGG